MMNKSLPRSTPEAQGIPSRAILNFVESVEKDIHELHSFMLLRHGQVVAEGYWVPYTAERPHTLFSLSKSFTSTAVGLAVAEGRLTLNDPVVSFFPEELPAEISENLAAMRVKQLLCMSTGHDQDTTERMVKQAEGNFVRAFLALPVEHKPGTHFVYNSGASYMLSAIVQKVTGQTLLDYLSTRLFEPLGIHSPTWESCPRGINMGGWGLSLRTEDIARFGQLYLQGGVWESQRILPEAWVQEATSRQVSNGSNPDSDWEQGYAYQFWRCRHGAYRGDGAFGQFCVVLPEQDAVLAITSGLNDMQAVLNVVWDCLLPAMGSAALPADEVTQAALASKLANLAIPLPEGIRSSSLEAKLNGRRFQLGENKAGVTAVTFAFDNQRVVCTVEGADSEMAVNCGRGAWVEGSLNSQSIRIMLLMTFGGGDLVEGISRLFVRQGQPSAVVASAVWTMEDHLQLTLRFLGSAFYQTITCAFAGDQVSLAVQPNVSLGPIEELPLVGRMA